VPVVLHTRDADFEPRFAALLAMKRETAAEVDDAVAAIIDDVAMRGDAALIEYTSRFDRVTLSPAGLRLSPDEIAAEADKAAPETLAALRLAAERIESFHRRQLPAGIDYVDAAGVRLGQRWRPIAAAGLYVPGGTAAYPSSVLMNAIPAKVAGVERLVMTVPAPEGVLNPLVMAAARLVGVDEVYRVGGAQAIAALAYGTATIAPVDKVVGPGNAYVAAAKRRVFGRVGIDMIAGPSEILVIADRDNDPTWIAADLLSQAEHDTAAQAILITDDGDFAAAVEGEIARHLARQRRRHRCRRLGRGAAADRPHRSRTSRIGDREPRGVGGAGAPCRRDLSRPPYAGSGRRLHRRPQPRAADGAQRALRFGAGCPRFHETHDDCRLRCGGARRAGAGRDPARRGRGSRRPRALACAEARFAWLIRPSASPRSPSTSGP
jgi:histidinol dehydrogenase